MRYIKPTPAEQAIIFETEKQLVEIEIKLRILDLVDILDDADPTKMCIKNEFI